MEIVAERGRFLSVPNEAIIEEGDRRVVYVQRAGRPVRAAGDSDRHPGRAATPGRRRPEGRRAGRDLRQLLHRRRAQAEGHRRQGPPDDDHQPSLEPSSAGGPSCGCWWRRASLLSVYAIRTAPLDAIPDISDPQIIVYVKWPRSPQLLETEVTEPLIRALVGSPEIQAIRGTSHMGYSFIYVILNNDRRAARRCSSWCSTGSTRSGRSCRPTPSITLGPNASSMGWIYQYALVDREGAARSARAAAAEREPDQAGAAGGAGRGRGGVGRRARKAVPGQAVSAAAGQARHLPASR